MAIISKEHRNLFRPPGPENNANADGNTNSSALEDGRTKEWQDRARVNLDKHDSSTKTNIERDYEENDPRSSESSDQDPVY